MAASSSMATPMGRFSQRGASSVITKHAMPKLTGTLPTSSAISEVIDRTVERGQCPKLSVTGFHSFAGQELQPEKLQRRPRNPRGA